MIRTNLKIFKNNFNELNAKPLKVMQITNLFENVIFHDPTLFTNSCLGDSVIYVSNFPNTSQITEWPKFPRNKNPAFNCILFISQDEKSLPRVQVLQYMNKTDAHIIIFVPFC